MAIIHHGKNGLKEKVDLLEQEAQNAINWKKQNISSKNKKVIIKYLIIGSIIIPFSLIMSSEHILRMLTDSDYLQASIPEEERGPYKVLFAIFSLLFVIIACIPSISFWAFVFSRVIPIITVIYILFSISDKTESTKIHVKDYPYLQKINNEVRILKAGQEGEEAALRVLKTLPDSYHIFTNCQLTYGEKQSETDIIVVGLTSVFIIEVKNHKGIIAGNTSDENLLQFKSHDNYNSYINYGTTQDAKQFYNPVKQIGTHIWCLSHVLQDKHIRTWVNGCVLFTNCETDIRVNGRSDSNIPIYGLGDIDGMINHICTQGAHVLSPGDIDNIVQILSE